ncbi:hypothetical protein JTB14_008463 [Gonioctena quinquepunctata]|nr:hypothetical protein JTB14_008463 [Gonioctena quinquepunctata]
MGIIPTVWKEGRLVTILKAPGRDPSDMGSLRPITLLSELGKMLERIIISKIQKAIPANRLISDNQFGFSKEKSTVDAIKHMIGHIDTQDKHHLVVFIDIKGAFNNMWWPTLLKILHEVEIPTQLVALLNNYLKDRKIRYQSNLEQIEKILTKGCPQGSALGPFLWNLTMEPLLRARWPNKVAITAYADDIALAINADSRRELEELVSQALEIVSHWAESHKLDIAVNKTKYIVFSKLSINRNPIVRYRDVPIDRVRHLKYLGVILDERMSFTEHIGYISNEARSIFQSLRKFILPRWGNCVDSLKKIYQVAIIPIVGYASEVWLDKAESRQNKQKLRSMQCFCLRVILGAYRTVPNETACVLAKQLPIDLELLGRLAFSELRKIGRTIILGHEVILREYRFWVAAALQVRAWLVGAWQALWNSTSKGRHCHELIPNLSSWIDIGHNQFSRVIISFLSSHGNCGAHFFRIGKRNSPECDICGEEDTPAHRLRTCIRFTQERIRLEDLLETAIPEDLTEVIDRLGPDIEALSCFAQ